jgi:hypothetical protein
MRTLFRLCSLALALAVLLAPAGFAQTNINNGALAGTVTDGSSALPGVTVTATSPVLIGSRTAVTEANGEYIIPLLPPGIYHVDYSLSGVKSQVREGVRINATQTTRVDVVMSLAVSETVTVTASQIVVDPTQTQQTTNLKEDRLKYASVGSANRSYQSALQSVPEAVGTGNVNLAGNNINSNTFLIDGINALTDPVTHTFASNMSFDAIQEVNVLAFGKDAEFRSSGGTVNVITKSGGNQFSGSFDYRYFDPDFFTSTGKTYVAAPAFYGGPPVGNPALRFNKAAITDESKIPTGTLGGPIMKDKMWFFASVQKPFTSRVAANTLGVQPGPRDFEGWNTLGKVTFTPWSNHTFAARHTNSYATISNILQSAQAGPEADGYQSQHNKNMSLNYDGVLSSRWLVSGAISHTPAALTVAPMSNNIELIRYQDLDTTLLRGNYNNAQGRKSYRDELLGSSTYYLERFGNHALKVGFAYDRNGFNSYSFTTGDPNTLAGMPANVCASLTGDPSLKCGVTYTVRGGIPVQATLTVRNPRLGASAKEYALYAQDQWNPISQLTIRAGLRYDHVEWHSTKEVPDFKLIQPRFGVAYDLFNNGGTVIHGFGGKIIDENQVTLPNNLNVSWGGTAGFTYCATATTLSGNRCAGKVGQFVNVSNSLSASGSDVDPNLHAPFSNEYSIGFTQRIFRNTSIDITAEKRTSHNLFAVFVGDVGPDYANPDFSTLTDGLFTACPAGECGVVQSKYQALITKIDTKPSRNSDISVSWTHGKSQGSTANDNASGQNVSIAFQIKPTDFVNYYGYTPDDAKDRIKINGYYRFPWDITLGGSYNWDSGTAFSVTKTNAFGLGTEFLEPRGSRRFPHFQQLDLQLQKDFQIGPVKAGLIGSVINVLNTEYGIGINANAGSRACATIDGTTCNPLGTQLLIDPNQQTGAARLSPTFLRYTSFQRPRRFEAGVRFEF